MRTATTGDPAKTCNFINFFYKFYYQIANFQFFRMSAELHANPQFSSTPKIVILCQKLNSNESFAIQAKASMSLPENEVI